MNQLPNGSDAPPPILRHPGRWFWLLLLIPAVAGLSRLHFDAEVFDLLPTDLSVVQGLKLYQEHFANARELIITLKATDAQQGEDAARKIGESLRHQTNLTAAVTWEPPWLEHPEQAAELVAYLWFNQPSNRFRELTNRLAPERLDALLTSVREELATSMSPQEIGRMSYDPFGLTRLPESAMAAAPSFGEGQESFSSKDGTFRILFVKANQDLHSYRECDHWLKAIQRTCDDSLHSDPRLTGVSLGYTGRPAFVSEIASGMEHDITISVGGTAAIIAVLFYLAHKRVKPMLWLLTLLAVILGSTLALGGLIFGNINVVSMGFAAILLGLAVDYAVVHYQEALAHPNYTIPQVRHAIAPSIFWAAVTTISAFLVLNFGGLPGLGQLGTLVGLGVALAALVMIFEFLPPLFPERIGIRGAAEKADAPSGQSSRDLGAAAVPAGTSGRPLSGILAFMVTGAALGIGICVLAFGLPQMDPTANALRPRNSSAYAAAEAIQANLGQSREPLWLILNGATVEDVGKRLDQVDSVLANAASTHLINGFTLPASLWPRPGFQNENRLMALRLADLREVFREAARTNGFAESSLALTERILDTWQIAGQASGIFWPTNPMSQWILEKLVAHTETNYFALGLIHSNDVNLQKPQAGFNELQASLPRDGVWLSGWGLLGQAIFSRVRDNLIRVLAPMVVLVLLSLFLAFRRLPEILLSLAALFLSALCLLAVMRLLGWSWNLLNLMAVPLVLGTGVDYGIFMQLALRRYHGDLQMAYQSVGRALLLCGGTAIAGFGSLSLSSNIGMASLGQVCAVGVASNMIIAIFLLPFWWQRAVAKRLPAGIELEAHARTEARLSTPSSLYRPELWRAGLWIVRLLPPALCSALSGLFVSFYWNLARHRRETVINNLVPALKGNRAAAEKKAKVLSQNFARKVVDLWRYEAGLSIADLFGRTSGWEHFAAAQEQKRGVLLLTPHLGNWEFGGPLLTQRGVRLHVITLAEPGEKFTELRQASRARWNIETFVVRDDPLAFVEIIQRLEAGATVALLLDRPPPPTAVMVELFGRPFAASIAAAELARASGCALLPVYLPRRGDSYEAHVLPPIPYDRAALRDRAARQRLTETIIRVFEPIIQENLDQWYHFVPVWTNSKNDAFPQT